ncbi:MAG: hypothetical protein OEM39_05960 [Acidimicrobiia bacterium]|nr:hypothetical protein [Acidimicrobiia bacterium]
MSADHISLWTFSDAHVGTDLAHGRSSLADAIGHSERGGDEGGPPFGWDLAIDLGDMSGGQEPPEDAEGEEVVAQFEAGLREHAREQIYNLGGNHDRNAPDDPDGLWWQRWVDPLGQHPEVSQVDAANRPYPIEGTWERYSFVVGNILFLMMSDINEPTQRPGRGELGGNPGGVVSGETFRWWVDMVESNQDKIIVSAHHYVLKETTVASGDWEGMRRTPDGGWKTHYHGYKPLGTPRGASYLYWVDSVPDGGAFESYLATNPGAIDIWLGGHTHTHPDDTYGDKSHIERRFGVWFANISALTAYHGPTSLPMSRHWEIDEDEVLVRCYLHTSRHGPQGWYDPAERKLNLGKKFRWSALN